MIGGLKCLREERLELHIQSLKMEIGRNVACEARGGGVYPRKEGLGTSSIKVAERRMNASELENFPKAYRGKG